MGGCLTRLKKEMVAPPARSGNWDGLAPQRPDPYVPKERQVEEDQGNGAPLRKETQSGIPGLTYDHAGRPVWREENAARPEVEHRETRE